MKKRLPNGESLFHEVMRVWIKPELKRRKQEGGLQKLSELRAAQVILIDGLPAVRLNEDVQARLLPTRDPPYDTVTTEELEIIALVDEDDQYANVIMMLVGDDWKIAFNTAWLEGTV